MNAPLSTEGKRGLLVHCSVLLLAGCGQSPSPEAIHMIDEQARKCEAASGHAHIWINPAFTAWHVTCELELQK